MTPVNLSSAMIGRHYFGRLRNFGGLTSIAGNGCTDEKTMVLSYYDMQCKPMSVPPITDITSCVTMKRSVRDSLYKEISYMVLTMIIACSLREMASRGLL